MLHDGIRASYDRGLSGCLDTAGVCEIARGATGDADLVETSLRFITSHPAGMVVIPGATKPEQVLSNAAAGSAMLEDTLYERLLALRAE